MKAFTLDHTPILSIATIFDSVTKQIEAIEVDNHFKPNVVGNIYVGKVIAHAEGMEGAFIDIGLPANAYIQRNDLLRACKLTPAKVKDQPLSKLVKRGQLIIAQIDKAPYQMKGAQLSTDISLTGGTVVFMPFMKGVKVSRKASGTRPIDTLEKLLKDIIGSQYGVIVRSAALNGNATDADIINETTSLKAYWENLIKKTELIHTPKCIHNVEAFDTSIKEMLKSHEVDAFFVESNLDRDLLVQLGVEKKKILVKASQTTLLQEHGVSIEKALTVTRHLSKEGVSVTINELEAFTIADVNSSKYSMDQSKRKNVFEVNAIAADLILRQVLMQKLSGVIMIDFIDMTFDERLSFIQHLLSKGYDKNHGILIEGFTSLGILEMTRKREIPSNKDLLSQNYDDGDLMYLHLHALYCELKRLQNHTNTKQVIVEVEDAPYVFLKQNNVFEKLMLKVELKHNLSSQKNYRIHTVKH
jgi:ribonuclease G